MQFTDLLHNLELTVTRYVLLPPSLDDSGAAIMEAARAAARLVGETLGKRVSRAAVREYKRKVGEWRDNCVVEFELTQSGAHVPNGKPRRIGVMKYVGSGKPPQFTLAEGAQISEQVHCGGGI